MGTDAGCGNSLLIFLNLGNTGTKRFIKGEKKELILPF